MSHATFVIGDVFDCLAALPDGSVDLILTSPPFLALRSYLPADHPDKAKEIGSEPDPASFVDTLLALSAEWRRVLAPHGSIAVELGDTYSGSGGAGGDYAEGGMREGQDPYHGSGWHRLGKRAEQGDQPPNYRKSGTVSSSGSPRSGEWPLAKSACLIPELYRIGLVYGRNPLTGEPSPAGQWRARNTVRWCRPNPPVGALGDKFRPATSDMVIACVSPRRWFDLDAVREPFMHPKANERNHARGGPTFGLKGPNNDRGDKGAGNFASDTAGAPPKDWWEVSTECYSGSHYATWPRKLLERPIKSMCPLRVCTVCGEPSRRIVEAAEGYADKLGGSIAGRSGKAKASGLLGSTQPPGEHIVSAQYVTLGWTDCGHDSWRPGVVLDPFAGSGTTLAVATGHGRTALGFDLDERNADLARGRVGPMFFTALTLAEWIDQRDAS